MLNYNQSRRRLLVAALGIIGLGWVPVAHAQYCTTNLYSTGCSAGDYLGLVQFNTINNNTGTSCTSGSTGYNNFTSISTNVSVGQTHTLTLGQAGGWSQGVAAWCDWNGDFDFTDPGEYLGNSPSTLFGGATWSTPVTIPGTALPGPRRLRARAVFAMVLGSGNACTMHTFGEVEDYTVNVAPASPNDMGVSAITSPSTSQCGLTTVNVSVTVNNFGTNSQSNIPIFYNINGGPPIPATVAGPIASTASQSFTFPLPANVSVPGTYVFRAWTALPGDGFPGNDSATTTIQSIATVSTYPYFENFNTMGGWTVGGTLPSWAHGAPSKDVIIGAASTPNCWVTGGLGTGNYNANEDSWIMGPCFNFSPLVDPVIELDIWWESETNWDGAILQFSTNNGATWTRLGTFPSPFQNWYNQANLIGNPGNLPTGPFPGWGGYMGQGSGGWVTARHDLTGLGGQASIRLRIVFGADASISSDGVAIDNIRIYDKPAVDVGVASILSPSTGCNLGSSMAVSVRLANFGIAPQVNIPVSYRLNGGAIFTETFAGPLAVGATQTFTFQNSTINASAVGNYTLDAWTALANDTTNLFNDSVVGYVFAHQPTIGTFPYIQDFESAATFWDTDNPNLWKLQSATGANVNGTGSGLKAWTTADPSFPLNDSGMVFSPCFNFSSLNNPVIALDVNWNSPTNSGTVLQASTNNGATWFNVGTQGSGWSWFNSSNIISTPGGSSQGWTGQWTWGTPSPSSGWVLARNYLTGLANQPSVRFRVVFQSATTGGQGFAFDDVIIKDGPNVDLGPDFQICAGDSATLDAGTGFVSYSWNGGQTTQTLDVIFTNMYIVAAFDTAGFFDMDTVNVIVSDPQVTLGPDSSACEDSPMAIGFVSSPGVNWVWSDGTSGPVLSITNDTAGVFNHFITVTDTAGCVDSDTLKVTVFPNPIVDLGPPVQAFCSGASTSLSAATNVPQVAFVWSSGVTTDVVNVTAPGVYWVQAVSANGCTGTDTVQLNVMPTPSVNLGPDITQCANINVTLNAAQPGSTYFWSTGATTPILNVTQVGSYWVEVTNGLGCTGADSVIVGQSLQLEVNLPDTVESCGPATLNGTTPGAQSYLWSSGQSSPSIGIAQSGTYTLQAIDSDGCIDIASSVVNIFSPAVADFWSLDTLWLNTPAQFVDQTFPVANSWAWFFGNGTGSNQQNPEVIYDQAGSYQVMLIIQRGPCQDTAYKTVVVEQFVGLNDIPEVIIGSRMYPNPTMGRVTVEARFANLVNGDIRILDLNGRILRNLPFGATTDLRQELDLATLGSGVYTIEVATRQGSVRGKLVVY